MSQIDRVGRTAVVTRFWMFNGVPLRALETYLETGGQLVPIPRNARSVAAGFLRPWVTIFAVMSFFLTTIHPLFVVIPCSLALAAAYFWLLYGRLSTSEKRMRLAYATWLDLAARCVECNEFMWTA